jgi:hypothetical protein
MAQVGAVLKENGSKFWAGHDAGTTKINLTF